MNGLEKYEDFSILLMPDHPTPLSLRTHTAEAVPFVIYNKKSRKSSGVDRYDEFSAGETGLHIEHGHELINMLIKGGANG